MSGLEKKRDALQQAVARHEARLHQAWGKLAHSARPDVQVERQVASRPHTFWLGAFATGLALGWLHGRKRRLLS